MQWAFCNGALMQISQNATLFSLLGTAFGGNGTSNFQLPNLAGRMLCGTGTGPGLTDRVIGDNFGASQVSLTLSEIPPHSHSLPVYSGGTRAPAPTSTSALSTSDLSTMYAAGTPNQNLSMTSIGGGGMPHENQQPVLAMNWSISLYGIFPAPE
jgi:microcystin-dependent protein